MSGFAQENIKDKPNKAIHGQMAWAQRTSEVGTYRNVAGAVQGVKTLTVSTGGAITYKWIGEGIPFTHVGILAETPAEAADLMRKIMNSNPQYGKKSHATVVGAVISSTARFAGTDPQLSENDPNLAVATVTNATNASNIGFGKVIMHDGVDSSGDKQGKLFDVAGLTARSLDVVVTGAASVTVTVGGKKYSAQGIDGATIEGILSGLIDVNLLTISEAAGTITIVAATAGTGFEVTTGGLAYLSITAEGDDVATLIAGVALHTERSAEVDAYLVGHPMDVLEDLNGIFLQFASTAALADVVYVGSVGDERGVIFPDLAAGRVPVTWKIVQVFGDFALLRIKALS